MLEKDFQERIKGVNLTEREEAFLRKHFGLKYKKNLIPKISILGRRTRMLAWHKFIGNTRVAC